MTGLCGLIGDLHIGANLSYAKPSTEQRLNSRLIDYKETFEKTIDDLAASGVKNLILTGDLFESRAPPLVQQKIFSQCIHRVFSKGIEQLFIIEGNHDQTRLVNSSTADPLKELHLPNLHIYDEIQAVELKENGETIANLITLPYRDRKWFGVETAEEANAIIEKQLNAAFDSIKNDKMRLLVGHVCVEGTVFENEDEEFYGENQLFVPKRFFERADVSLVGHVHAPEVLSKSPYIAYVGSMEKRSGSETHDKLYAVVDTSTRTVEYRTEPCREIYDLKLDYSHVGLGEGLFDRIAEDADDFAKTHVMENSIVKISLKIAAPDGRYVEPKRIYRMLKERHQIHHCVELHPELHSERQARNDQITEQVVDTEAFRIYLETIVDEKEFRSEILQIGTDIIRDVAAQDAAK